LKPASGVVVALTARLRHDPGVAYVEQDHTLQKADLFDSVDAATGIPYDWAFDAVHAGQALAAAGGGSGRQVAVIDTGIDANHPDLVGHVGKRLDTATGGQDVTDPGLEGIVLSQDPTGGTQAPHGSTVTITVGRYTAPPLPTDVTQAVEAVNQAGLSVQNAQANVDNATLTAPYSGVITSVTGNPGDQVTSATTMAGLVDPARVELDAQVDETTYGQVKVGMPVQVRLDALPGQVLTGVVTTVVPSGVTTQGVVLFPVVIQLNTQGGVPPNQASASQITVIIQAKANVLVAPSGYISRSVQGQPLVDVMKDGKRTPTVVTLGLTDTAGNTEITSGLKAGDQIAKPLSKKGSSGAAFGQGGVQGLNGAGGGARPAAGGPGGR